MTVKPICNLNCKLLILINADSFVYRLLYIPVEEKYNDINCEQIRGAALEIYK